jgi:hypothetical protein
VRLYVTPEADKSTLPTELEGMPVDVKETSGFRLHQGTPDEPTLHQQKFERPVPMGVSTGNANVTAGTLGLRVRRIGSDQVGYITNNHLAASNLLLGVVPCQTQVTPLEIDPTLPELKVGLLAPFRLAQCQPGLVDGGICDATSTDDKIGELVQVIPTVSDGQFLNTMDAAFVESNRGCVSKEILGLGSPQRPARNPRLGQLVRKSGRTTGVTEGRVTDINVTVQVSAPCGEMMFVNQAVVTGSEIAPFSAPGDSGAAVLDRRNRPTGLLFAGDDTFTVITPMPSILNALGVVVDTQADDPPSATCP